MSTSLLAFLTLLEKRALPLLPAGKTWRFQRIVDFGASTAALQLWEEPTDATGTVLSGQVNLRANRQEDGAPSFHGSVQNAVAGGEAPKFSFHPNSEADVERQAQQVAEMWGRCMGADR